MSRLSRSGRFYQGAPMMVTVPITIDIQCIWSFTIVNVPTGHLISSRGGLASTQDAATAAMDEAIAAEELLPGWAVREQSVTCPGNDPS